MDGSDHEDGTETEAKRPSTYPPHHSFNLALSRLIKQLMVKDKRQIYVSMRNFASSHNGVVTSSLYFPKFGFSAEDFSVLQILNDHPRRTSNRT